MPRIAGQRILEFLMRIDVRESGSVIEVQVADGRDNHAAGLRAVHGLGTVVGQSVSGIDYLEFPLVGNGKRGNSRKEENG